MKKNSIVLTFALLGFLLLAQPLRGIENYEEEIKRKAVKLPHKKIKLEVKEESVSKELKNWPVLNFKSINEHPIESCSVIQTELKETDKKEFIPNVFPLSMDKRWYYWLRYSDSEFMVFRENKYSRIYCARFSRGQVTVDFWNIDINVTYGKEEKDIILLRDKLEENGPSEKHQAITYLYVAPSTVVYHGINFLGRTAKTKVYKMDRELSLIDLIAYNKRIYMVNTFALIVMTVNEDKMIKDSEIIIKPNSVKQLAITNGKLFLFIKSNVDSYELVANNVFDIEGGIVHLKAKKILIIPSGNRRYVFHVSDDSYSSKGKYYYIINPSVSKPSNLVFSEIPDIHDKYLEVFELHNRIHFVNGIKHQMYMKGSEKQTVRYEPKAPIVGMLYWSAYQYIAEDQFLLQQDKVAGKNAVSQLRVASVYLTPPKVICTPRPSVVERYEKFSVYNRYKEYKFEVHFLTTGKANFQAASLFDITLCMLFGLLMVGLGYVCFKKTSNDRAFEIFNKTLIERGIEVPNRDGNPNASSSNMESYNESTDNEAYFYDD